MNEPVESWANGEEFKNVIYTKSVRSNCQQIFPESHFESSKSIFEFSKLSYFRIFEKKKIFEFSEIINFRKVMISHFTSKTPFW
jgi:hypothetical protein